jgi:hypothetical protein
MSLLSQQDHDFFAENGYIVVPNAVPQANLDAILARIWEFLGMNPDDSEDWYRAPHRTNGMVEMYQNQAIWNNRQEPRIHQIFTEILGTPQLWVSIDRACMKPPRHPAHPEYDHKGFIHWDTDVSRRPPRFHVQGVLFLEDTEAEQGGFQCSPEVYRQVLAWGRSDSSDPPPTAPDPSDSTVIPVPGKAGDLLIWNSLLPHGNGHNVSQRPRLAQYISMHLSPEARSAQAKPHQESIWDSETAREERIVCWRERFIPDWARGKAPRETERGTTEPAELTPLGRKLLGLDRWE